MRISDWSSDVCSSDLFLHRRAFEAAGILFLVLAGALALAMASYDSLDPSLNSAAGRPAQNLLGGPGAPAADIALQSFVLAALVLRSEERRVGKEWVSPGRSRWPPDPYKKTKT